MTAADFLASDLGGSVLNSSNPYDTADNGLTSSGLQTPDWLNTIVGLTQSAAQVAGQVAPIVNGKAAGSPANPAAKPNASGTAPGNGQLQSTSGLMVLLGLAALGGIVLVLFKGK